MSSAVSNIIPNPLSHKHEGSPHSLSTLSSSPACGSNFSPNQTNFSQPNCGVAAATSSSTNSNGNGYHVYGVSPTEGSTASGICSGNSGPMSNVENSLTGNIDNNSIKMKENDFYISDEQLMQMSNTNISNHDRSIPSTPATNVTKEPLIEEEEDEEESRYNLPPPQQHSMQMQIPPFDQITYARKALYPINPMTDRNVVGRIPYAYNRPNIPIPYPIPEGMPPAMALNRSQVYHPMMPIHHYMMHPRFMHPQMGMMPLPGSLPPGLMHPGMMSHMPPIPPPSNPPPPPQPKPKSRSRKQNNSANNNNNNQQQQQQLQPPQPPMHMMQQGQFMKPSMDMMRASSSAMGPPDMSLHHQNQKINGNMKHSVKRYRGPKITDRGSCHGCKSDITMIEQGIFCTALSQGCFKSYHPRCQNMVNDVLGVIAQNEHIEWVCQGCTTKQLIWNADS